MVTHQLHFLKNVDKVIVLHKGEIAEIGTFSELMSNSSGRLFMLLEENKSPSADRSRDGNSEDTSMMSMKSESQRNLSKSNQNMIFGDDELYWDNDR